MHRHDVSVQSQLQFFFKKIIPSVAFYLFHTFILFLSLIQKKLVEEFSSQKLNNFRKAIEKLKKITQIQITLFNYLPYYLT